MIPFMIPIVTFNIFFFAHALSDLCNVKLIIENLQKQ